MTPDDLRNRAAQLREEARWRRKEAANLRHSAKQEDRKEIEQARLSTTRAETLENEARAKRVDEQYRADRERR